LRRFTFAPERLADGRVTFDRDESHHITRVLRLGPGATIVASDGSGREYTVCLERVGDTTVGVVTGTHARHAESPLGVTLLQGVPKADKMDAIIRGATELGVARISPAVTERTVIRLAASAWTTRTERWQRIAREATKQCGRTLVPHVDIARPLGAYLEDLPGLGHDTLRLCVWEQADRALASVLDAASGQPRRALVLVGPEGGLSPEEADAAHHSDFVPVSLGPRVLRTETAALAVLAILLSRFGDLGR
jgi:16S rRNA (uracil1498-N3)-methyltransferase